MTEPPFPAADEPAPRAPANLAAWIARAREVFEFAVRTARRLQLPQAAGSLTFSSVLALVPLLAVVLSVLTAFPFFAEFRDSMERDLPKGLLPVPYAQTILRYLTEFAGAATGVGAAGVAFLAVSALSMILTVDRTLNDIFQVRRRRPLAQRLVVYWAVLSVGPLLLAVSLTLTSYVISMSAEGHAVSWGPTARHLFALLPPVIATTAYTAAYALVPNRRVAFHHALTGGLVTALTSEVMSRAFAAFVLKGSVTSIYGAFAAVPVFLMWIYLSWLSFLFGAAIAATLPQLRNTRFADAHRAGNDAITAVALLRLLHGARAGAGVRGLRLDQLALRLRSDDESLANLLLQLEELGYVRRLAQGDGTDEEWVFAADPGAVGLGPVLHRFALDPDNSLLHRSDLALGRWLAPVLDQPWLRRGLGTLDAEPPARG